MWEIHLNFLLTLDTFQPNPFFVYPKLQGDKKIRSYKVVHRDARLNNPLMFRWTAETLSNAKDYKHFLMSSAAWILRSLVNRYQGFSKVWLILADRSIFFLQSKTSLFPQKFTFGGNEMRMNQSRGYGSSTRRIVKSSGSIIVWFQIWNGKAQ